MYSAKAFLELLRQHAGGNGPLRIGGYCIEGGIEEKLFSDHYNQAGKEAPDFGLKERSQTDDCTKVIPQQYTKLHRTVNNLLHVFIPIVM